MKGQTQPYKLLFCCVYCVQGTQTREGNVIYRVVNFCITCGIVVRHSTHFMISCALFIVTLKTVLSVSCVKIHVFWDMMFQLVNSCEHFGGA